MAKYPGETKVFRGLLYFEVADERFVYKYKMLGIKTNFCLLCDAKVGKMQNIDFWYDAVYDVAITKDDLPKKFIENNPDFVYVIEH